MFHNNVHYINRLGIASDKYVLDEYDKVTWYLESWRSNYELKRRSGDVDEAFELLVCILEDEEYLEAIEGELRKRNLAVA